VIEPPTGPVRLPALEFPREPVNDLGQSGLDDRGVPLSFKPGSARVAAETSSKSGCLELRSRPNNDAELKDCLVPETDLNVLEARGEWRRVQLSSGLEGWVRARGLETVVKDKP
jgi:hypothetical protein